MIAEKSKEICEDFLPEPAGVSVLAAGGSFGTDTRRKKDEIEILKDWPLDCSEAANRKTQCGPKLRRLHREQCHRAGGVSKHASKNS